MAWKNATLQEKGCFVFQQNLTKVVACTERCSDNNVGALAKIRAFVRQSFFMSGSKTDFWLLLSLLNQPYRYRHPVCNLWKVLVFFDFLFYSGTRTIDTKCYFVLTF